MPRSTRPATAATVRIRTLPTARDGTGVIRPGSRLRIPWSRLQGKVPRRPTVEFRQPDRKSCAKMSGDWERAVRGASEGVP